MRRHNVATTNNTSSLRVEFPDLVNGNHKNGDGCSEYCQTESAACAIGQDHCINVPHCGDAILTNFEACDDDNQSSGDGCQGDCAIIEEGWGCLGAGQSCRPICGNGSIAGGETCDDGNVLSGDGCSAHCSLEVAPPCANGQTTECTPSGVCGDGELADDEECDEGPANRDGAYGGCTANCRLGPYCGDAIVNGLEACDLGSGVNTPGVVYGDLGCSMTCRYNPNCGDSTLDTAFGEQCDVGPNVHSMPCSRCVIVLP